MALDLTSEIQSGWDDAKAGRLPIAGGATLPCMAYDVGYWMGGPGGGGTRYPRPEAANPSRGARMIRVKWSVSEMVNVVRCDLGGAVWEWVNAKTIRRA